MNKILISRLCVVGILFWLFYLVIPHTALAAVTITSQKTTVSINEGVKVDYSGANKSDCYVWRLYNVQTGEWIKPRSSDGLPADKCDNSSKNYISSHTRATTGTIIFDNQPVGDYNVYFFKSGGSDCTSTTSDSCSYLQFHVVATASPTITPTP